MHRRSDLTHAKLIELVKAGRFSHGGNQPSKPEDRVYGSMERTLIDGKLVSVCRGGRSIRRPGDRPTSTQVFFESEGQALNAGFRPCSVCMRAAYKEWKDAPDRERWKRERIARLGG